MLAGTFKSSNRKDFIQTAFTELIEDSIIVDVFDDDFEDLQWNSYSAFIRYEEDIPSDKGIVDKLCSFFASFCKIYSEAFVKKVRTRD